MPARVLSTIQYEACTLARRSYRFSFHVGAVRSGKTWAAMRGFLHFAGRRFSGEKFALVAHSWDQMTSVVLSEIEQWLAEADIPYIPFAAKPKHIDIPAANGGSNRFLTIIGDKPSTVKSIDGMTLAGAYLDEGPLLPVEVMDAVVMRCSQRDAKIVSTANPQGPLHWYKRDYMDRHSVDGSGEVLTYGLYDNPTLDPNYIKMLHAKFSGALLKRKVYGLWAASSGAIFPTLDKIIKAPPRDEEPWRYEVSADYAASSVTHAILWARYQAVTCAVAEWRHDGERDGQMPVRDQAENIVTQLGSRGHVAAWVIDPTAEGLIAELRHVLRDRGLPGDNVMGGFNDVETGLSVTIKAIEDHRIRIAPNLRETIRECADYAWDEDAGQRGDDRPARGNDHAPDALRYYVATRAQAESRRSAHPRPLIPEAAR